MQYMILIDPQSGALAGLAADLQLSGTCPSASVFIRMPHSGSYNISSSQETPEHVPSFREMLFLHNTCVAQQNLVR